MLLKSNKPTLFVVAVHIGNPDDITLRALKILKSVDFIICEERKAGSRILRQYEIKKPIELLNEHNEAEEAELIFRKIVENQETAAIISDAGTPLFADPGRKLVWMCHQNNVKVIPVPGASSIMAALMGSGIIQSSFRFYGFLSANKDKRIQELKRINRDQNEDLVFLEAPYRLKQILRDMKKVLGGKRNAMIAYKLTQPEEKFFWGNIDDLITMTTDLPKGEFVFILKKIDRNKWN